MSVYNPTIMAITESWLRDDIEDDLIRVCNYSVYRCDRRVRQGGGVCIFVKDFLETVELTPRLHPDFFESVWLFFPTHGILFVCLYVPPITSICRATDVENFVTNEVDTFMNRGCGRQLVVCGDFNRLPLESLSANNGLLPLVNFPTRGDRILDNILMNDDLASHYSCSIGPPVSSSDHKTILCMPKYSIPHQPSTNARRICLDMSPLNVTNFVHILSQVNWREFYNMTYSTDEKCEIMNTLIGLCIEETIPTICVPFSQNEKPWITPRVKDLINQRWKAYRNKDFVQYNKLKAIVKSHINKAKLNWGLKAKTSSKNLWRVVNEASGRSTCSIDQLIAQFTNREDAANAMNLSFVSVFDPESVKLMNVDDCTVRGEAMCLSPMQVFRELQNLKVGKSPGSDKTPVLLYKRAARILCEPLSHLFNVCLHERKFPSSWKLAYVVPVPKCRNPTLKELRPISLLPTLSKVFEKLLAKSVMAEFKIAAGSEQHGGFLGRSTATASILIHDHVTRFLDSQDVSAVYVIAYDISKAFDKIRHSIIVRRLTECGFPSQFVSLMKSYLSERFQQVKVHESLSSKEMITSGVPQGSVLGPLLFAAVMGTLTKRHQNTSLVKFVDDITLIVPTSQKGTNEHVNEEDQNVRMWAEGVGLTINQKKSKYLVYRRSLSVVPLELPFASMVDQHKILGIIWTNNLDWKPHFECITKRFVCRLHCLRVLKGFVERDELMKVYHGLLLPLLEYCSPLFVGMSKNLANRLEKLQNRAHRIICGSDCQCGKLTSLSDRRMARALTLFSQAAATESPLHSLLPEKSSRSDRAIIPLCKTKRRQTSFIPFMILNASGFHT